MKGIRFGRIHIGSKKGAEKDLFNKKRKFNKRGISILLAVVLLLAAGGYWVVAKVTEPQGGVKLPQFNDQSAEKNIDILLLGIDARGYESSGRSDTMMLLSIHPKDKMAALVSIPRDTLVVDGRGRNSKINALSYIEGPESTCRAVSEMLNINVDHYVIINFDGFAAVIDILGGIEMDIPARMYHWDPVDPSLQIDIPAGQQRLSGQQALNYVRFRGTPTADIGRVQRQQEFLKTLFDELKQSKNITKVPAMISEIYEYVETDMSIKDMVQLANMAKKFSTENIVTQTLPGRNASDPIAGSCWKVDPEISHRLIEALFAGESFDTTVDAPASYSYSSGQPANNSSSSSADIDTDDEEEESNEDPAPIEDLGSGELPEVEATEGNGDATQEQDINESSDADDPEDEEIPAGGEESLAPATGDDTSPATGSEANPSSLNGLPPPLE